MKKNILILGGSSEIAQHTIVEFLNNNWQVYAHYNKNSKFLESLKKRHKLLNLIKCNFEKKKDVNKFIQTISKKQISSVVNLVGYIDNISFKNTRVETLTKSLQINTIIPLVIQKNLIPFMIKSSFGRILNISSIGVKYGGGEFTYNYSFAKHALEYRPSYLRNLASKNVFNNILRIGFVNTKLQKKIKNKNFKNRISMIPIKRSAKKEEVSKLIYYLASEKNTYLTNEKITIAGGE